MEIFGKSKAVTSDLQAADCFLECFFVSLADTHDFAHCTHLCAEFVLNAFEFLKCPSCKFNYHIVAVRHVFVQCAVFAARDLIQCQTGSQHCGNQGDRESGCFTCKCGRTGSSRINLDDDDTSALRIVCKLYVRTADHFYFFYDFISLSLQLFLNIF